MTSTGGTVDLSGRKNTFNSSYSNNPVLTAAEAAEVSNLHNMFATIDWDPTPYLTDAGETTAEEDTEIGEEIEVDDEEVEIVGDEDEEMVEF